MNYELWSFVGALVLAAVLSPLLIMVVRRNAARPPAVMDPWLDPANPYLCRVRDEEAPGSYSAVLAAARAANSKVAAAVSPFTPVCPECGLVDHTRPFVRSALGCLRTPCGQGKAAEAVRDISKGLEMTAVEHALSTRFPVIKWNDPYRKEIEAEAKLRGFSLGIDYTGCPPCQIKRWHSYTTEERGAELKRQDGIEGGARSGELGFDG